MTSGRDFGEGGNFALCDRGCVICDWWHHQCHMSPYEWWHMSPINASIGPPKCQICMTCVFHTTASFLYCHVISVLPRQDWWAPVLQQGCCNSWAASFTYQLGVRTNLEVIVLYAQVKVKFLPVVTVHPVRDPRGSNSEFYRVIRAWFFDGRRANLF